MRADITVTKKNNVVEFKRKEKTGITKTGTVTIKEDGTVHIDRFSFNGVDMDTAMELARSWALKRLQEA